MNSHQIIGEVVHQLIKENSYIDYEIIRDRVVREFMRVSVPGCNIDEAQAYESALKIFTENYNPKI
ncbi:hypothetical protein FNO19_09980 [Salmonella enterica subsp. salamae]|nr:hypothetical protein [Salmonella enterica subsp. salamae]SQH40191.1 Uncharacterised protein [Salmonella enterica]